MLAAFASPLESRAVALAPTGKTARRAKTVTSAKVLLVIEEPYMHKKTCAFS
jgi:hypothetical protein